MPQFQHIYDGKNEAVNLPSGERLDRAQQNMSQMILNADKMRLDAFKANEEWFLKTTDVPIESFLSSANTEAQAKMLDEYNKSAVSIVKSRGGMDKLTMQDKLELTKGRQMLESEQQRMLGDLEKYKTAKAVVDKNPDYYDQREFNAIVAQTYMKDGKYPDIEIPIKEKPLELALDNNKVNGTVTQDYRYYTNPNGQKVKQATIVGATEEESRSHVRAMVLSSPQYQKYIFNKFSKLSDKDKLRYLDTDNSGTIDANERDMAVKSFEAGNPLLKWAEDNYWQLARTTRDGGESGATPPSSSTTGDMRTFKYGTGSPTKYYPTESVPWSFGDKEMPNYHPFPQFETYLLPIDDISVRLKNGSTEKIVNKTLKLIPTGYDESTDEFTFNVTAHYKSRGTAGNGDQISIKRNDLPPEFGAIEVKISGKPVKISDIKRSSAAANDLRVDGTKKGNGFLGKLERPDGRISTEISIGVNIGGKQMEIPTLIPTITEEEKKYLLSTDPEKIFTANPKLYKGIQEKAIKHAQDRIKQGLSPFASGWEDYKRK